MIKSDYLFQSADYKATLCCILYECFMSNMGALLVIASVRKRKKLFPSALFNGSLKWEEKQLAEDAVYHWAAHLGHCSSSFKSLVCRKGWRLYHQKICLDINKISVFFNHLWLVWKSYPGCWWPLFHWSTRHFFSIEIVQENIAGSE